MTIDIAKDLDCFSSEVEMNAAITELFDLLVRTTQAYPGILGRRIFFDKSQWPIEEKLHQKCASLGNFTHDDISCLLFGQHPLTLPEAVGITGNPLFEVSPQLVRSGALLLNTIPPDFLFSPSDRCWEDYDNWRKLVFAAAAGGEALIAGN